MIRRYSVTTYNHADDVDFACVVYADDEKRIAYTRYALNTVAFRNEKARLTNDTDVDVAVLIAAGIDRDYAAFPNDVYATEEAAR